MVATRPMRVSPHEWCSAPRKHAHTHTPCRKPARCTKEAVDRFGIPNPRKSGSVIGADRQRFGPSCVLLKRMPHGRTESGGIVPASNAGPRVPSGGVTLKRRCTYRPSVIYLIVNRPSVIYLIVNKLLSLSLYLSLSRNLLCVLWHLISRLTPY
jgi:hypothetical protein